MSLKGKLVLITGASMGIGAAIARRLAAESATLLLLARSIDKLRAVAWEIQQVHKDVDVFYDSVDVQDHAALSDAISIIVEMRGPIDILVNNAGLALGAPNAFPDLKIQDIITMTGTNINGFMFVTYAVLNEGKMKEMGKGKTISSKYSYSIRIPNDGMKSLKCLRYV